MGKMNVAKRVCVLLVFCAATAIATPAQTYQRLHGFDGTDGRAPAAGLVQGTDGKFYGTTEYGGANNSSSCDYGSYMGCGTVFSITPDGALTTLYNFCSQTNCADGASPSYALIQGTDGNFYGTARIGGANGSCYLGCGTVFSITPGGTLTTLHNFDGTDGQWPEAGLVQGTDGNFYGTTVSTVFSITPGGALTTLYNFCSQTNCADGNNPVGGLAQGTDGRFYGTTYGGGANDDGTVFSITAGGALTTLHSFAGHDGRNPEAGLVQGSDGNFYGTTNTGGIALGGTIFKITPSGNLTTLHKFCQQRNGSLCTDGEVPYGALIQGTDGNFYGTTNNGGSNCVKNRGCGTVFSVTASGTLTTIYSFCVLPSCKQGGYPRAGLIQDTNGNFYGTTFAGGAINYGTVYSLSVGLGPFVKMNPVSGAVGAAVTILGTNLTGATSVTFNGTEATFTVVSASEISTTVPTGATTGTVQVVTPGATLSSKVPFRVLP